MYVDPPHFRPSYRSRQLQPCQMCHTNLCRFRPHTRTHVTWRAPASHPLPMLAIFTPQNHVLVAESRFGGGSYGVRMVTLAAHIMSPTSKFENSYTALLRSLNCPQDSGCESFKRVHGTAVGVVGKVKDRTPTIDPERPSHNEPSGAITSGSSRERTRTNTPEGRNCAKITIDDQRMRLGMCRDGSRRVGAHSAEDAQQKQESGGYCMGMTHPPSRPGGQRFCPLS